jgi:hypothetical protein
MSDEASDLPIPIEHADQLREPPQERIPGLTLIQEHALRRLAAGSNIVDAARSAGVDRRTLHRWIKSDPDFAAAYNAWQQEVIASGRARVLAMSNKALDTVQAAIEKGDAHIAMQIAKSTGLLEQARPGPTSAPDLSRRQNLRARRLALKRGEVQKVVERDELFARIGTSSYPVNRVIRSLDELLQSYRKHLAAETPEERALRVHKYDPLDRTYRLADLLLSDPAFQPPEPPEVTGAVAAPSDGAASQPEPARPSKAELDAASKSLDERYKSILKSVATNMGFAPPDAPTGTSKSAPNPEIDAPPGSPPARSDNPDQPRPISSVTEINPPGAKVSNPYNPNAYDPLEDEPWDS